MKIKYGQTRIVFIFKKIVVKIPFWYEPNKKWYRFNWSFLKFVININKSECENYANIDDDKRIIYKQFFNYFILVGNKIDILADYPLESFLIENKFTFIKNNVVYNLSDIMVNHSILEDYFNYKLDTRFNNIGYVYDYISSLDSCEYGEDRFNLKLVDYPTLLYRRDYL